LKNQPLAFQAQYATGQYTIVAQSQMKTIIGIKRPRSATQPTTMAAVTAQNCIYNSQLAKFALK
jgi:hypothetical protein